MNRDDMDAPTQVGVGLPVQEWPEIEGYELLRELGRGGMGLVYLARHQALDRLVALKTLSASHEDFEEVLVAEARIASKLEHPGIVSVYEVKTTGDVWFFSMAFVDGEDLARHLTRKVLTQSEVIELALVLCDALEHAHSQGILHLDIKPANILLDRHSNPKIADFGLSALYEAHNAKGCFGTPQFMSPEQVLQQNESLTAASDVYSLGAVLYAALAGRPPLIASDPEDLLMRVVSQNPPSLREFGIAISGDLEAIIMHCLKKNPLARYQTATELKDDLQRFVAGEPIQAKPPSIASRFVYQLRRHVLAASVSGSAVLALLLLVVWVLVRSFTQSMELSQLRDDYDHLVQERRIFDGRLAASLTREQQGQLNFAVAKELAQYHAQDDARLAASYAAEALLQLDPEQRNSETELMQTVADALETATDTSEQDAASKASLVERDNLEQRLQSLVEQRLSLD